MSSGGRIVLEKTKLEGLITRLVNTDDQQEVRQLYRQWSASYDSDLDNYGYVAPEVGVTLFEQLVDNPNALIHDAGCGTGQVGQLLQQRGYGNVVGSDFSDDDVSLGINTLTSAEPGKPNGGAVFHDTAVWVRKIKAQIEN